VNPPQQGPYRGRLAPTPSGYLHLGHASTFLIAAERAQKANGELILRIEDLDQARCNKHFELAIIEDLRWLGIQWSEGPDGGGMNGPYRQSERQPFYFQAWQKLNERGCIYPCHQSRKDIQGALNAPHSDTAEVIFPVELRPNSWKPCNEPSMQNWRFRVPDGRVITFIDGLKGCVSFKAGVDFGDFLVWRKDGFPSYELAVVTDDYTMAVSEVVRGEDLLVSTARQLLLYEALSWPHPQYVHCPLVLDSTGKRLSKRDSSTTLRHLREEGMCADAIREQLRTVC
jgi:glutamyl-tRNA synthetase